MKLLKDHSVDFKTKPGAAGTLVLVKRSLADEAEMQI